MRNDFNIFANFSDSVVIVDPKTNTKVYFNESAHSKLGYTRQEFSHKSIAEVIDHSNLEFINKYHQAVVDGQEINMNTRHIKKDGSFQYADLHLLPFKTGNNTYVCTIWKDITEQVEQKKQLDYKYSKLNTFLEVLEKLTKTKAFKEGNIDTYLWRIVEVISKTLDIDRVSIRLYTDDQKELKSYAMYDKIKKRQLNGKSLKEEEHSHFFNYIKNERLIKIDDISSNEDLKSMIEVFFSKDGMIQSLLASKINIGNEIAGYVFFQSRRKITWSHDDILFANQISSNISMALINAKLIAHNEQLENMVEQRTIELKRQIEIAQKANQAKSQFLSNISHEIRTPLNAILGFISLVEKEKLGSDLKTYFERIENGANQLFDIVNDVLDMSKIESGKMIIHLKWNDVKKQLDDVVQSFESQFKQKNINLIQEVKLNHQYFFTDELRVRQILNNLISNAYKFTEYGQVSISLNEEVVDLEHTRLTFVVKDTGIGIKREDQKKLFSPFVQLEQADTKHYQGTGLGLSITKSLVEAMNGTISFESEWGRGSTFVVNLLVEFKQMDNVVENNEFKSLSRQKPTFNNILIVDDHPINLEFVYDTFEFHAKHIDKAHSGLEALKKVEENFYDLIIMDIHMPMMSGYQTSRLIKMNPKYHQSKIIALSADALDDKIQFYQNYGIDWYLVKPISSTQMIRECERVCAIQNTDKTQKPHEADLKDIFVDEIGFEFQNAMTYLGNKESLFIKLLKQFRDNHSKDLIELKEEFDQNNDLEVKRIVHNLKGVCKTLGMSRLSTQIEEFEDQIMVPLDRDILCNRMNQLQSKFEEMIYVINYITKYIYREEKQ